MKQWEFLTQELDLGAIMYVLLGNYATMMIRTGAFAFKGDTEGPGHLQPGKEMVLGELNSST